jgi:hypothetical protein
MKTSSVDLILLAARAGRREHMVIASTHLLQMEEEVERFCEMFRVLK